MNKNQIKLLPYIQEPVFGMTTTSPVTYGWEIKKFNIPEYWRYSRGEGVKIAVIDTGVDINHDDIKNNIIYGKNFVDPNKEPIDICGHGTHVSSTIAAEDNSFGIVGVANKAQIMPLKALNDEGIGDMRHIAEAIIYAADNNVDFITMSLGSSRKYNELENAIKYAANKKCILFCAAGNSGENTDIMYPAKYDHTIAIGAIDTNMNRTDFTCSGESLDFLAPGKDILGCVPNNQYALMSGTSMSNPFAVGLAALLCSYNKIEKKYKLDTCEDYIDIFKSKAVDLKNPIYKGIKKYQGYGIINPVL